MTFFNILPDWPVTLFSEFCRYQRCNTSDSPQAALSVMVP